MPANVDPPDASVWALKNPAAVAHVGGLGAGLGGHLRVEPEDFFVEEIPLFTPSGRGNVTIVQIEKRAAPTFDVLLFLSKQVKISERKIGYAGLKDSRAVARQYLSLPKVDPERALRVRHHKFRVLSALRNEKGLKIGYLRGNRFTIRIRGANRERLPAARTVLETLVARGMPNAYGTQRYGVRQDGHLLGRAVVREQWDTFIDQLLGRPAPAERNARVVAARMAYDRGDLDGAFHEFPLKHRTEKKALATLRRGGSPRAVFEGVGQGPRRIWVAAWQSYLFNRVLDARVRDDTFDTLLEGDVGWLHGCGALFSVRDPGADAPLARRQAASPTGPLIGYDMRFPTGRAGALEHAILAEAGTDKESFRSAHCRSRGSRRPLRVRVREASLEEEADGSIVARFVLPPGAFATVLLDHLMRPDAGRVPPEGESGGNGPDVADSK